jgi:haloacetate dehalogenase
VINFVVQPQTKELSATTVVVMYEGFSEHTVQLADVTVQARVAGRGPGLLFLHGYPQTMAMWARVAPAFTHDFTVVCADLRGYGESAYDGPDTLDAYSFRAFAADQVALMAKLGFDRFSVVGHDRGARTAHRMALDHPEAVERLALFDIAPTLAMLTDVNREAAAAYWHWYFLATAAPLPETLIGADPDFFFGSCFETWGATSMDRLDAEQVAAYRAAWNRPDYIHATCQDYRATMAVDLVIDREDATATVDCPTLVAWASRGKIGSLYNLDELWRARCSDLRTATVPGGHFFVDESPEESVDLLRSFLS